jgi:hypothetical protein
MTGSNATINDCHKRRVFERRQDWREISHRECDALQMTQNGPRQTVHSPHVRHSGELEREAGIHLDPEQRQAARLPERPIDDGSTSGLDGGRGLLMTGPSIRRVLGTPALDVE